MILFIKNIDDRKKVSGILIENNYLIGPVYVNNKLGYREIVGIEILKECEK